MNDWEFVELQKLCQRITVGFVGVCNPYYTDSTGVPLIRTGNLRAGNLDFSTLKYVTREFHLKNKKSQVLPGDLLIARHGSSGQAVLFTGEFPEANCLNIVIVRPKEKVVNPAFLKQAFNSSYVQRSIARRVAGSTQGVINTGEIQKTKVPLPPLSEQQKIAEILLVWDQAIDTTERLRITSYQRKKGLMQRLLTGQLRFPMFNGEWKEMELGQFLQPALRKIEKPKEGYLRLGVRSHGKGTFVSDMDIDDSEAVAMTHLFKVREGDLVVSITFAWEGAIAIVGNDGDGALVSHRFPAYTFDTKKVLPDFFRYVMLTERFFYDLSLISPGGAGRNRVMSKTDFLKLKIKVPSIDEQKKISGVLVVVDDHINTLSKKLDRLQEQKKGLTQKLLTGQIRVKV